MRSSQFLEDPEACASVLSCTWCFTGAAAATGIEAVVSVLRQPGGPGTVGEFEPHHITVLHRGEKISVLGEDLESGVRIFQPVASCHRAGDSTKTMNTYNNLQCHYIQVTRCRE